MRWGRGGGGRGGVRWEAASWVCTVQGCVGVVQEVAVGARGGWGAA